MASLSITRRANKLKRELLNNLEARGLIEAAFNDLVEEYINLWIIKEELNADILTRGAVVDGKENSCITKRIQISQQMNKIFKSLGFEQTAVQAQTPGGDYEL